MMPIPVMCYSVGAMYVYKYSKSRSNGLNASYIDL